MKNTAHRAIAIVGVGATLPDAPNVAAFWENVKNGRYSITEVSPDRWDPTLYYDPDHNVPDKTYSKIGGWVKEEKWDPIGWRLPIPPRVSEAMDGSQKWGIACTRQALEDYGYPKRPLDLDRTAVILGNAMGGEKHYFTILRLYFPEYVHELEKGATFSALPASLRHEIARELHDRIGADLPQVTEDTMPGELANCIAGRIANLFNFRGPNYVVDAACASAMAAISSAAEGLVEGDFDVAITGGIDRNMGASTFIKFSKIGALSATGTRPYAEGADGFVMGEGAAIFVLKRLADAERDNDKIYAVLRGMGGSSDGRGKGITAPNPIGQRLAIERAWQNAGLCPSTVGLIEGHGTSTAVGDVVEVESAAQILSSFKLPVGSVALGSVKSNIGHLKGAAGAAGLLKAVLALREKVLPPSVHCEHPNSAIDFVHSPLYVNTELRPWNIAKDCTRRAGLSAFGFGGTNFHAVLEEYIPHKLNGNGKHSIAVLDQTEPRTGQDIMTSKSTALPETKGASCKTPLRGALVIGAHTNAALIERLRAVQRVADAGDAPEIAAPQAANLRAPERLVIDYTDASDLADKSAKALKALSSDLPPVWKALRAQGIYRGRGAAPKVAFLYTGQGSQYVNMLRPLFAAEPIVAKTFSEADRVMTPLLGKPLTEFIFVDSNDAQAIANAENDLRQTAITQPAVLATDEALTRLLAAYGIRPDMTMGHSLGEYGALVASGALPFEDALEAVSARGRGMTAVAMEDNGKMAAVFAPLREIERILKSVNGYVVIANINSNSQGVIGGASTAVDQAIDLFLKAGFDAVALPVSHAFHTSIVAGAGVPLRKELERLRLRSPRIPIVANVDGEFYPMGENVVPQMLDILTKQVAAPVQFIKGLQNLYRAGARVFVEVGPKKALQGFAEDVLSEYGDVVTIFTNHPKFSDFVAFNQALCALYASGLGHGIRTALEASAEKPLSTGHLAKGSIESGSKNEQSTPARAETPSTDRYVELGRMFADVLENGWKLYRGSGRQSLEEPVAITGAALGLPGTEHIFDDSNVERILRGDQFIDVIPNRLRTAMLDKHITRVVKDEQGGGAFETITNVADVIKLAGRGGTFDLESEFGISAERLASLDRVTRLAIAAGLDALRDAGIPLVLRYKTTSKGTRLPDRWVLPDALRDNTGVIFASAFPGYNSFADEMSHYYADRSNRERLSLLESLRVRLAEENGHSPVSQQLERLIDELRSAIEKQPYVFDRRFLFRTLAMGHSQFAELIGARGPNTQLNAACASTTQAVALAEDWIRVGRCRRVVIVSADDVTSDAMMGWFGAGFLASGAAATDDVVEEAAIPFDRRRHGMIIGMGAAALVVESADAARERGIRPICEVLSAVTANSAFHGTRLDVEHIGQIMEDLVTQAEARASIKRDQVAPKMVFVSHETYTPARGGSAAAEIHALRRVFGEVADRIVIANTKGFTGHAMGTGIEDVVAVKALETGRIPPVANFKEVDPELGPLNLSKGGIYPVEYALRLGAGFGSQISMTLIHWTGSKDGVRPAPSSLGYGYRIADPSTWSAWLGSVSGVSQPELETVRRTLRVRDQSRRSSGAESIEERSEQKAAPTTMLPVPTAVPDLQPAAQVRQPDRVFDIDPVKTPQSRDVPAAFHEEQDAIRQRILVLVAEKTGYPIDMLDLDLDLEADLGVDTVKQAEVFSAVRETYGIARDDQIKLRDFPTLAHVIRFVRERLPVALADVVAAGSTNVAPSADIDTIATQPVSTSVPVDTERIDEVKDRILTLVVEKTGYPKDMLDLDLDLEADLGVDTVKQAEMFAAIREMYNIPRDENRKLRDYPTLAHVIRFVYEKRPDLASISSSQTGSTTADVPAAEPAPVKPSIPQTEHAMIEVSDEMIKQKVLEIVAEKTGYPTDMLDLDLDLEADLGIDTVKQAEMFASVRAAFNIPRDADLKLRDFPTLAHVIKFAHDRRPGAGSATISSTPAAPKADRTNEISVGPKALSATPAVPAPRLACFEACDRIARRVPLPTLRPPLSMCKPTGVSLSAGRRVVLMPDQHGVVKILAQRLQSQNVQPLILENVSDGTMLARQLDQWINAGPVHGVYWLPALDDEGSMQAMDFSSWKQALGTRLKAFYSVMRILYSPIATSDSFLISATRMGGQHGYDATGARAPLGGAVAGFTKAYKRERQDPLVKVVDFEASLPDARIADLLIEETLRDPGALEIGYKDRNRWTIALNEQSAVDGEQGLKLDKATVFLVTGAAGSIVSAITADLAAASGGTFYLLDVVPKPDPANSDLQRFTTDKDGLKRDLFTRIQARGERATPALVEKDLAALERAHAALSAIQAVRAAGGSANYFSVDLTDPEAVGRVIEQVRKAHGRIDVLVHAAGIERSHFLPDKDPLEFDRVFDVKSDGWFNLMRSVGSMPLAATVAFSSIAGRFGNAGQTDYSAANDLLCKMTSSLRSTRPDTRGIVIDWTAWGEIGMATRGSIPKMMEAAGIDMLAPEAGVPLIRRELTQGATRGEIVIGDRLGVLCNELDATGGLDTSPTTFPHEIATPGPMSGKLTGMRLESGLAIEVSLDPQRQPFLRDHRIDGTAVLPGVMGLEAFAEAARCLLPTWQVCSLKDVNFVAPFKFYRNEARTLLIETEVHPAQADTLSATCRLIGRRTLQNQSEPQVTKHFTGQVELRATRDTADVISVPRPNGPSIEAGDIYRVYFHGPSYQVLARAWWDGRKMIGLMNSELPPNHFPGEQPTSISPRLVELCFQTAGLWEIAMQKRMGLPRHFDRVLLWDRPEKVDGPVYAIVTPRSDGSTFDADVVDYKGRRHLQLSGYQTVPLPESIKAELLEPMQALLKPETVAA